MSAYKELLAQRDELERKIKSAKEAELASVIQDVKRKIQDYDLTLEDLGLKAGKARKARQQGVISPKYRNPATGDSWSGRGKAPKWIADKSREQFLIQR